MSKKSLVDSIEVKTPCTEDWNAMKGSETTRFCGHCNLNVNDISTLTRKQTLKLVRESDGRLCVRYIKNPVNNQPVFADQMYQIARRAPRLAAATIAATLSLSGISYAQGGVSLTKVLNQNDSAQTLKAEKEKEKPTDTTTVVSGTITDPTGAVIPNVSVTLLDTANNQSRNTVSNDEGFYEFKNVAAGKYSLKAKSENGFKEKQLNELIVSAGKISKQDIEMEIGAQFQTMGVVAFVAYRNPLHRAVLDDDTETIRQLIAEGANVNGKDENYDKITPLFIAVENGNTEIVKMLLGFGAKANVRDADKQTPLMRIDEDASVELVELLIKYGAKINVVDEEKNTPLMIAARSTKPEVLEVLVKHGVALDAQNEDGATALMLAAENDNFENVRFLLGAGAKVNLKDSEGDTAYDYTSDAKIEELLKSYGAEIKPEPENAETIEEIETSNN